MNDVIATECVAQETTERREHALLLKIRISCWCAALVFGFAQAWNSRFTMNSDGISYMDMADSYLEGGWKMLVNGHWSPMYPWLIASAKSVVKPSAYWEFTLVHILNFFIFLLALVAFELMLRELNRVRNSDLKPGSDSALPDWSFYVIAYVIFLSLSLSFVGMERPSPDLLMSVFVYLSWAIILRIQSGSRWYWYAVLGLTLGLGYYAKAPMFPLGFLVLAIALFLKGKPVRAIPGVLLATAVFLLLSTPLVVGLSRAVGHFSFGESGKWNYLTVVNKAGPVWYMQDPGSAKGTYQHPPQKIFDFPPVYAFVGPVGGTLPVWYDPSYWAAGPKPRLAWHRQLSVVLKNAGVYFDLLFVNQAGIVLAFFVFFMGAQMRASLAASLRLWPVWVPVAAALGMYGIVLVQERYVAVLFIILWTALLASMRLPAEGSSQRLTLGVTYALLFTVGMPLAISGAGDLHESLSRRHVKWEVARQLKAIGVRPGDTVGRIGGEHRVEWARLLGCRVIAEIPEEQAEDFWSSDTSVKEQILDKFRETGATAVIAEEMDPWAVFVPGPGWQRVGQNNFFIYMLSEGAPKESSKVVR